jgi:hypothetical protein
MSTLEARLSYFRFTPNSRPYVKLIDWPKGAMNRLTPCSKQCLYPVTLASSTVLGSRIVKVDPRPGSLSTVMSPPII